MKWFFGFNAETSYYQDYISLIKVAVNSAKLVSPTLEPHMIYDGSPCPLTEWATKKGVTIHYIRSRYYKYFHSLKWGNDNMKTASGAFLRAEIPELVKKNYDDKYVLYTDCDVIFTGKVELDDLKPKHFAAAPEIRQNDFSYFNSGVMLMNIEAMHRDRDKFQKLVLTSPVEILRATYDQNIYNILYKKKWDILPNEYNWKPYWGANNNAKIIHLHGLKGINLENRLKEMKVEPVLDWMYRQSPANYRSIYERTVMLKAM
jgi:hypothetical protein